MPRHKSTAGWHLLVFLGAFTPGVLSQSASFERAAPYPPLLYGIAVKTSNSHGDRQPGHLEAQTGFVRCQQQQRTGGWKMPVSDDIAPESRSRQIYFTVRTAFRLNFGPTSSDSLPPSAHLDWCQNWYWWQFFLFVFFIFFVFLEVLIFCFQN